MRTVIMVLQPKCYSLRLLCRPICRDAADSNANAACRLSRHSDEGKSTSGRITGLDFQPFDAATIDVRRLSVGQLDYAY